MSSARAIRYRRLALASSDKANADLLLRLADECDRFSAPLNGDQPYHIAQSRETTGCGLRVSQMTEVEKASNRGRLG